MTDLYDYHNGPNLGLESCGGQPMNDNDIKLPPLPRLQVPFIEADVSMIDIKVLAQWCERTATAYARAAVLADRDGRQQDARDGRYMSGVADLPEATCERCGLRVISSCCPDNPAECPVPDAYEHRRAQRGKEGKQ